MCTSLTLLYKGLGYGITARVYRLPKGGPVQALVSAFYHSPRVTRCESESTTYELQDGVWERLRGTGAPDEGPLSPTVEHLINTAATAAGLPHTLPLAGHGPFPCETA